MKTHEMKVVNNNLKRDLKKVSTFRPWFIPLLIILISAVSTNLTFAHCDTMDGPLISDAKKAIMENNVNYALKWVSAENEKEIKEVFDLMMKVRGLSPDAKELSEKYFFETLVRIHRAGEGVPFTGVKPSGTPVDEKVLAADKSIEDGNLLPLKGVISEEDVPELTKRFDRVMSLKTFDVNDVEAGREYIEAYVQFFRFAEGESENHTGESHRLGGNTTAPAHHEAH